MVQTKTLDNGFQVTWSMLIIFVISRGSAEFFDFLLYKLAINVAGVLTCGTALHQQLIVFHKAV